MRFAGVRLPISVFVCSGKGVFCSFAPICFVCFEIVFLGPPVCHFLFDLFQNQFFEQIFDFCSRHLFFHLFLLFMYSLGLKRRLEHSKFIIVFPKFEKLCIGRLLSTSQYSNEEEC